MVEAPALIRIVDDLADLLDGITAERVRESEAHRAALNQTLAALNLTKAYLADRIKQRPRDRQREEQLSMAWTRAAGTLESVDPELAERCRLEGEEWTDPTSWDPENLEEVRTGLDEAALRMRTLLTA